MRHLKKFKKIFCLLPISIVFATWFYYESSKGTGNTKRFSRQDNKREGQEYSVGRGNVNSNSSSFCFSNQQYYNPPEKTLDTAYHNTKSASFNFQFLLYLSLKLNVYSIQYNLESSSLHLRESRLTSMCSGVSLANS